MPTIGGIRVNLGTVDVARVHERLAHQEFAIVFRVVKVVTDLFVLFVQAPNFRTAIAGRRDKVVVIGGPVHIVDQVVMPGEHDFEGSVLRLNVENLHDCPT